MTHGHPPTPCLPLPLELRKQIYAHLFAGVFLHFGPGYPTECHAWASRYEPSPRSILLVSKQTRSEAISMLYNVASIHFGFPPYAYKWGPPWASQFSRYAPQRDAPRYRASWEEEKRDHRVSGVDSLVNIAQSFDVAKSGDLFGNCGRATLTTSSSSSWAIELRMKDESGFPNLRFVFRLDESNEIDLDKYELGTAIANRHDCARAVLRFFQKAP